MVPSKAMKTYIFWAAMLALATGQSRADLISNGLFEHYAVSASEVVGSGYIRLYGPTNDDYSAIFTGWLITAPTVKDPVSEDHYPAYDSIEALNLGGAGGHSDVVQPTVVAAPGDAYTLLFAYVNSTVCIGDTDNPICRTPGMDIPVTVSSTVLSGSDGTSP
jgi:hypothetical protein